MQPSFDQLRVSITTMFSFVILVKIDIVFISTGLTIIKPRCRESKCHTDRIYVPRKFVQSTKSLLEKLTVITYLYIF